MLALILAFAAVNQSAHDRFPNADQVVVETLAILNRAVNHTIAPVDDRTHYGVLDQWVSNPPDLKGDCEDYALTKLVWLENNGFPALENSRIRFVFVKEIGQEMEGHAVLEIRLSDGSIAILDNRFDELMTRRELERTYGYRFFDW